MSLSVNDLVVVLEEKHGFSFTEDVVKEAKKSAALKKSSGIDGDAGDWTENGDGTDYPSTEEVKAEEAKHEE